MSETSTKVTPVTPEYKAAVTKLAHEQKNQRFLNDSPDHAKLLAKLMIGRAKENDDVLIYSKSLPSFCYDDALQDSKSHNIRVILEDESGVAVIDNLPEAVKAHVEHRVLATPNGAHFWVAGKSFRLELDHQKAKAIANFSDPEAVQTLRARFEKLWSST
jgi:hypothetical protein